MATPTQTGSRSMARVRPYRESDLAKLQGLFHKNYPELVTPEFTNQDQLSLVLEDERGQVKMAIMGNPAAIDRSLKALPESDQNAILDWLQDQITAQKGVKERERRRTAPAPRGNLAPAPGVPRASLAPAPGL